MKYRVTGALFENEKETGPAFSGFIEIDGVKTAIALWPKTSAKGQNYLQVGEDRKKNQQLAGGPAPQPSQGIQSPRSLNNTIQRPVINKRHPPGHDGRDMDDDIPF